MLDPQVRRLLDAYPAIFLACHRRHIRDDATGRSLTEHQASVLDHLDATRPTPMLKLAEHMGVGASAISIMVARLVSRGFIMRRRDPRDGRSVLLTLSPAGQRVKDQNTVLDPQLVAQMFRLMAPGDLEAALHGLEQLAARAQVLLRRRHRRHAE